MIEIKDEILTGEPRYRVRDNNGNITQDNVTIEQITPVKQEGTEINKKLLKDLYDDVSPIGNIKLYSNKENRPKKLLCDGSIVFASDYPKLRDKIIGYDLYSFKTYTEAGITGARCFYINGYFIVTFADKKIYYSEDGNEWTTVTTPVNLYYMSGENGDYFATAHGYYYVYHSTDLVNWTRVTKPTGATDGISATDILYKNGVLVIGGDYGHLYYSLDKGKTWVNINNGAGSNSAVYFMGYVKNKYIVQLKITGSARAMYISSNGTDWEKTEFADNGILSLNLSDYNDNYIYAIPNSSEAILARSEDGINFENFSLPQSGFSVVFVAEEKVYLFPNGLKGNGLYSSNLIDWHELVVENTASASFGLANNEEKMLLVKDEEISEYYLDGREKKMVLPTMIDETNQLYGYINSEE